MDQIEVSWLKEDGSLMSLFVDLLEIVYTTITYSWVPDRTNHAYN